jgi:hypothetical protein
MEETKDEWYRDVGERSADARGDALPARYSSSLEIRSAPERVRAVQGGE